MFFLKLILFTMVLLFIMICQGMFWKIDLISKSQAALGKFGQKVFDFTRNMLDTKTRHISISSTLSLSALLLIAIIIPSTLINSKGIGNSLSGDDYRCNYETQRWAKENTDAKAKFILHRPGRYPLLYTWRTLTGCALVQYYINVGLYVTDLEVKQYGDELVDFYSGYFNLPADLGYKYNTFPYEEYFSRLDAAGLQQFSKRFGGDYIVQLIETKPLNLPITYQSDCLVIYQINDVP
jgi:hypothetical protein